MAGTFNAQDPTTWPVQFGRQLTQDEINYYAPQMQDAWDRQLRRESINGRNKFKDPTPAGGDFSLTPGATLPGVAASNGASEATRGQTTQSLGLTSAPGSNGESIGGQSGGSGIANSSASASGLLSTIGQNPYLQKLKQDTASTMTDSFNRQVLPGIQQSAVASGGYGGSRQGVIEANAMNDLGKNIGNAMTSIDAGAYNTALNYDLGLRANDLGLRNNALGYYNADNSYSLGLGNLGLGYANLDRNINNDNIANNMMGAQFGLNIYDRLQQGNNAAINAGGTIHNTPMNYWQQFSDQANGIGRGFGSSTSTGNNGSNPVLGALGGAQLGSQIGQWWGGSTGGGLTTGTGGNGAFMNNLAGMGVF